MLAPCLGQNGPSLLPRRAVVIVTRRMTCTPHPSCCLQMTCSVHGDKGPLQLVQIGTAPTRPERLANPDLWVLGRPDSPFCGYVVLCDHMAAWLRRVQSQHRSSSTSAPYSRDELVGILDLPLRLATNDKRGRHVRPAAILHDQAALHRKE